MNRLIEQCKVNSTITKYLQIDRAYSMKDFGNEIRERAAFNCRLSSIQDPEDLIEVTGEYLRERADEDTVTEALKVLKERIFSTANHLGGIYSPQSFQGDIFYAWLMKGISHTIPIFTFGQIPFRNSANPKGILLFKNQKEPLALNLIPRKYEDCQVGCFGPYTKDMADNLIRHIDSNASRLEKNDLKLLKDYVNTTYMQDGIFEETSYANQVFQIGRGLSKKVCNFDFLYLNAEDIFVRLILKDMRDENSLLYHFLNDQELIDAMNESVDDNPEHALACQLFWGIDECLRKYPLRYDRNRKLRGDKINKEAVEFAGDTDTIEALLTSKEIIPSVYLMLLVSAFARGYTWNGGIFQAEYLPDYQKKTVAVLKKTSNDSYQAYADIIENYNFEGYLSGPIFMLDELGEKRLATAGPVELLAKPLDEDRMDSLMNTSLYDAHMMGIYEFYNDLVLTKDKAENWYEKITEFFFENYKENRIS